MRLWECEGYKKLLKSVDDDKQRKARSDKEIDGKMQWILDRVKHYSDKTGLAESDILNAWEKDRSYWYFNYYQDSCQPLLDENVKVFNTITDFQQSAKEPKFRCPACGGISSDPYECNSGTIKKDIKDGKERECNWKSYGLFGCLGKGAHVFIKDEIQGHTIFMPVAWEK
jgi:hypothetical protein